VPTNLNRTTVGRKDNIKCFDTIWIAQATIFFVQTWIGVPFFSLGLLPLWIHYTTIQKFTKVVREWGASHSEDSERI
jgi:hypothetical protein